MPLYLISYDISERPAAEYQRLWDYLKGIAAVKILHSAWVVVKGGIGEAKPIHDQIAPLIRPSDRLLVQELFNNAEWTNLIAPTDRYAECVRSARDIRPH